MLSLASGIIGGTVNAFSRFFKYVAELFSGPTYERLPDEEEKSRRIIQILKDFDAEWELLFGEEGPFYDKAGVRKVDTDFSTIIPLLMKMMVEMARRNRAKGG